MNIILVNIFKHPVSNSWTLFWLLSSLVNIAITSAVSHADLASPEDISYLIGYSVRWAIPFIYFVVAASSIRILFTGIASNWWIRNRKYVGLVFAVAMAWHGKPFSFFSYQLFTVTITLMKYSIFAMSWRGV